jgi:integrase
MLRELTILSQRISGTRRPCLVIDPARYDEFFHRLKDAPGIDLEVKAWIAVSVSAGLRVTESLALRPADFDLAGGYFKVRVLKKREFIRSKTTGEMLRVHKVTRDCKLHSVALELLTQYLTTVTRRHFESVFQFSRQHGFNLIRGIFGEGASPHTIARHSHMSWLLHEKEQSDATVARMMEVSQAVVSSYSHVNGRAKLDKLFKS